MSGSSAASSPSRQAGAITAVRVISTSPGKHRQLVGHGPVQGPAGDRHQPLQGAVGVAEDAGEVGIVASALRRRPAWAAASHSPRSSSEHPPLDAADRLQDRRPAAGQGPFPQAAGQAQHRSPVAHHLGEGHPAGPLQREHRAPLLPHRRQLGRIAHEHQAGAVGMGAAQGDLQQGPIHHRGLIDQHQPEILQGQGRLLGLLAALPLPFPLQLQPQQPVDGGGVPGGLERRQVQMVAQHPHRLVGGGHHGPAETGPLPPGPETASKGRSCRCRHSPQHEGLAVGGSASQASKAAAAVCWSAFRPVAIAHPRGNQPAERAICQGDPSRARPGRATGGPIRLPTSTSHGCARGFP